MLTFKETDGGREGYGYRGETDDCAVKSISIALKLPYAEVHEELKQRGRKNGRGTHGLIWQSYLSTRPNVKRVEIGSRMNVWSFFQRHQSGTFLIAVTKHLTCIRDGVYLDQIPPRPRQLVRVAYEVTDSEAEIIHYDI